MSAAWFCPACQKHHAPHVETCPGDQVSDPWGIRDLPRFKPWHLREDTTGVRPICDGITVESDPTITLWNGTSQ